MKFLLCILFLPFCVKGQQVCTVLFDFNKHKVSKEYIYDLQKLTENKSLDSVHIAGHCDSVGSKNYNYKLSENRALAVKNVLAKNGFNVAKISTVIGYGKDKPLNNNSSEIDRALNRRVEVTFYNTKQLDKVSVPIAKVEKLAVKKDTVTNIPITKIEKPKTSISEELKKSNFKVGTTLKLSDLYFYGGYHILKPQSYTSLYELVNVMKDYPNLEIEIQGHVCCTGPNDIDGVDQEYKTQNLSYTRAKAVYLFLLENGIDKFRMRYKGFGGSQKISEEEETEEQKSLNRRVEIKILKN